MYKNTIMCIITIININNVKKILVLPVIINDNIIITEGKNRITVSGKKRPNIS